MFRKFQELREVKKTKQTTTSHSSSHLDLFFLVPSTKIVCYKCALKVFKQLAYQFRVAMRPSQILPVNLRYRDNCYYGRHCRTQYTKAGHAQKFNHACEQTRQ